MSLFRKVYETGIEQVMRIISFLCETCWAMAVAVDNTVVAAT